jgi:class 3 adenylate cyclase/tetratricopeptide (TPR) repeat protein
VLVCPSCGQENPEIAKFCLACGSALEEAVPSGEERKLITVLFCDIVGSTATAEQMDPEDVRARLAPYYERARSELESFGGTVEKFIGDAVVALFGAPIAHEDDAERAVRAALALRDAIDELNAEDEWLDLKIRVGVNTGVALVVLGARATEGEGMAAGDVMNTAARLQSAAPVNGIVVGEPTFRATREAIEYRKAEAISVKGKSEPVRIWEVVGARDAGARDRDAETALVGRQPELERLRSFWTEAKRGRAAIATVVGPPGVGKSRLLAELTRELGSEAAVLRSRCLSYGEGITYGPITEMVKIAAGILQSDDSRTSSAKLAALLDGLPTRDAEELRTIAAAASNLVGSPRTPRGTYAAVEIAQRELHWGIRRLLELMASTRPVVALIEDLHWAEPTLLDLLQFISESDAGVPILVVASARRELLESSHVLVRADRNRVELDALSDDEGRTLLRQLAGGRELPDALVLTVLRNAEGNPLFLEELVAMAADEGLLGGGRELELESLPVPDSVQALIGSRLDLLEAGTKHISQHASVVGHVFWRGAVAALAETNGAIDDSLDELVRREFVRPRDESTVAGEREYTFKHILIRDVAYGRLPKGRRADLHLRFASWLQTRTGTDDEFVEILAYHLERSCRLAREIAHSPVEPPVLHAVDALKRAAEKASSRESAREGDRFLMRAMELVGDEYPEVLLELRVQRGRSLAALGEITRAVEQLLIVAEEAPKLGRLDLRTAALITVGSIDLRLGHPGESRPRLLEAEALALQLGDRWLQIKAGYELSTLYSDFDGEFDSATAKLARATTIAEEIEDHRLVVEGHLRLGFLLFNKGDLAGADEALQRCVSVARKLGSHRDEARATFLLGLTKYYRGELDLAERLGLETRAWLERTGETYFQIQNDVALALYALARGEPERAEALLREAVPIALEEGRRIIEVYRFLVETLVLQNRAEDATELAEFASRNLPEDDIYSQATVRLAEALAATGRGDRDDALLGYRDAVHLYDGLHLPIETGQSRIALARALQAFGDDTAARAELDQARVSFTRIGATGMVADIDRSLEALGSATSRVRSG